MFRHRTARLGARGSALLETAVLMPVYLILLFGLLFLGYSTLLKQKEHLAGSFAVWNRGRESPASLGLEFGMWASGSSQDIQETADGAVVGDGWLSIEETRETSGLYETDEIAPQLFNMTLGERVQYYVWEDGQLVERIDLRADDASRYLREVFDVDPQGSIWRTDPSATPESSSNLLQFGRDNYGMLFAFSDYIAGILDSEWTERRTAALEYEYRPWFRPIAYSEEGEEMTTSQYLSMQFPEHSSAPVYKAESRLTIRGEGSRSTIHDKSGKDLILEMSALVGDGSDLEDPMTDSDLDALRITYWPDGDSLWVSR